MVGVRVRVLPKAREREVVGCRTKLQGALFVPMMDAFRG